MKIKVKLIRCLGILIVLVCLALPAIIFAAAVTMQDYCQVPPFIGVTKPNLLLMFDNSGSMYDLQYFDNRATSTFCYDNTYDNRNTPYVGYFDASKYYSSTGVDYATDITTGNTTFSSFTETASLPPACTYKTAYLCANETSSTSNVETQGSCKKSTNCKYADCHCYASTAATDCAAPGDACQNSTMQMVTSYRITDFTASGNFLNWLTASKMDIQKNILTGGKYVTKNCSTNRQLACRTATDCPGAGATCDAVASPYLQGESRGCVGSRFVKEVPLADWTVINSVAAVQPLTKGPLSFGVRGDVSSDIRMPSTGGTTRIDIFKGDFNSSPCQTAVNCWATCGTTCGNCKNDTDSCLNLSNTSGDAATWNHALQTCWTCAHQPCCPEDIATGDITRIWSGVECGDGADHTGLDYKNPKYVCLKDTEPSVTPNASTFPGCLMNDYAGDVGLQGKYLGVCEGLSGAALATCTQYQFAYFCKGMQVGQVTDPTSGPADTTTSGNIPGNLIDGGLTTSLGNPERTFHVRVATAPSPTGLINDFASVIRFGAMKFNNYGSASECGASNPNIIYSCSAPGNEDGSLLMANVGGSVGDHTSGLVKSIDDLVGGTWTPFSEAMFNAIGYYAMTPSTTSFTVERLNSGDFGTPPSTPPPSQSNCQKNNVLYITDGQSTTDLNSTVTSAVALNHAPAIAGNDTYDTTLASVQTACPAATYTLSKYSGSRNFYDLAWFGQNRKISNLGTGDTTAPVYEKDKVRTFTVFSGQDPTLLTTAGCSALPAAPASAATLCSPDQLMCYSAKVGGGTYYMAQDPTSLKQSLRNAFLEIAAKATSGTAASVLASGEGSGANLIQALFYPRRQFDFNTETLWAGSLQTLWYYVDPFFTYSNIREDTPSAGIQDQILNLGGDYIANLQMLGTCSGNSSIFCATDTACGAAAPCLQQRVRVKRYRDVNGDGGSSQTYIDTIDIENIHSLWEAGKKLWSQSPTSRTLYTNCINSALCVLDSASRSTGVMSFSAASAANVAALRPYLQAADANESTKIIRWIRGYDKFCTGTTTPCTDNTPCTYPATCSDSSYRARTVGIDLDGDGVQDSGETQVWKLGDVLNSTPKIASWMPLNTFHRIYLDSTYGLAGAERYPDQGHDDTHYITSTDYMNRGMVFAGANDGMLHAFKLGTLGLKWASQTSGQKATLGKHCTGANPKGCILNSDCDSGETCLSDTDLGKEVWTFIPKNALPYLKYMSDPNYCHVYSVDLTPYIFDASIEGPDTTCTEANYWNCARSKDSWRTILIGGMRLGGGCKARVCSGDNTTKCANDSPDCNAVGGTCITPSTSKVCSFNVAQSCTADSDCPDTAKGEKCIPITVGTPILDPADPTKGFGYSSYFALDITETLADSTKPPRLLWEFSDNNLGFSSSGPALVRIRALKDPSDPSQGAEGPPAVASPGSKDGRWFVVFGSGPTGPISDTQFLGSSDQNLSLFVLDLKTGSLLRRMTMDGTGGTPVIANAFSGSMLNANFDSDLDYQDDIVYSGYVKKSGSGTWTDGGVGRLVTGDRVNAANHYQRLNPNNWTFSILKDGVGPVTSSVVKLQDNTYKKLWVYFGTGRYFYKTSTAADDNNQTRTLYGIKDPCFDTAGVAGAFDSGCTSSAGSVTDVTSTATGANGDQSWSIDMAAAAGTLGAERVITDPLATSTGLVFFTTFAPYSDICTIGGNSYIWALKYDTGGAPGALLKGKALVQVSTGKIEQVDLSTQFTEAGGRRTAGMEGVPPTAQGLSIISSPPPIKRVLHMRER